MAVESESGPPEGVALIFTHRRVNFTDGTRIAKHLHATHKQLTNPCAVVGLMSYTREDARRYAQENIARICAEQGITVAITDPVLFERAVHGLSIGKQRADAARIKGRKPPFYGVDEYVSDLGSQPAPPLAEG